MRAHPTRGPRTIAGLLASGLLLALAGLAPHASAQSSRVDIALVLAFDCSYSVDAREFELQRRGLAQAFLDEAVVAAAQAGRHGRIAVTVVQWSADDIQTVAVPWRLVDGPATAAELANRIAGMPRLAAPGSTSISAVMAYSATLLEAAPFAADKRVIDVATDGINNLGPWLRDARNLVVARGITINGLAIQDEVDYLHHYLRNRMIGGPGAFVEIADDYDDFPRAIRTKLLREILPAMG
ncbi:DUF1194 domain-containing protein [Amorphus coralli]|uniref:DUF1194 domain-containing protein n=1 Tax=Amorphus coralli TaxID=340680 RepID=UPI00058C87A8|nr:DUF1194 domain-containing protein [Amorphus coralli]